MKKEYAITAIATVLIVTVFLAMHGLLPQQQTERPEKIENSSKAQLVTKSLAFQGSMQNVKLSGDNLVLDTSTVVEKEEIAEGKAIAGATDEALYLTKQDGSTVKYQNGEEQSIGINSLYGSATGDFDYPGFNIVYGNENGNVFIRNIETGEEKQIASGVLEVVKVDKDSNGIPETAQVRLENGTNFNLKPVKEQSSERRDWDGDGFEERFYIKNNNLVSYDQKHGEEPFANATDFVIKGNNIYTAFEGKIYRLGFNQKYKTQGTYRAKPLEYNESKQIVQFISEANLQNQQITATVETGSEEKTFQIKDGYTDERLQLRGEEVSIRFELSTENPSKTPVLQAYQLVVKE